MERKLKQAMQQQVPQKEMVQEVNLNSPLDFVQLCNYSRIAQIAAMVLQTLFIYSEASALSYPAFIFYFALCGIYLYHIGRRWWLAIDGRYDLRQLWREPHNTLKIQYAIAVLSSSVLSELCWWCVELENPLVHSVSALCSLTALVASHSLLLLEAHQVIVEKKHL